MTTNRRTAEVTFEMSDDDGVTWKPFGVTVGITIAAKELAAMGQVPREPIALGLASGHTVQITSVATERLVRATCFPEYQW